MKNFSEEIEKIESTVMTRWILVISDNTNDTVRAAGPFDERDAMARRAQLWDSDSERYHIRMVRHEDDEWTHDVEWLVDIEGAGVDYCGTSEQRARAVVAHLNADPHNIGVRARVVFRRVLRGPIEKEA